MLRGRGSERNEEKLTYKSRREMISLIQNYLFHISLFDVIIKSSSLHECMIYETCFRKNEIVGNLETKQDNDTL
jgi:hypothetical protein